MRKYEIAVVSKNGYARTVRIYAPKNADRAVIMHDGQNVFYDSDATYKKSWRALDALKSLGIKNTAVIGVDSAVTRELDYPPFPNEVTDRRLGGGAEAYMSYVDDGLIPYLDGRFAFKSYAMVGSSFGALSTLYYAARNNKRFKAYGILSAPLFVSPKAFTDFFDNSEFDADGFYEIYTGGSENVEEYPIDVSTMFVHDAFTIADALRKSGVKRLRLTVENEGVHDETCWRDPLKRLLTEFSKLD
ncbi:MAG: hypothetical protein J1G38_05585 [Clostridiales bacterium]|nr:hypothetical protein [Clostridiales bacterium]